MRQLKARDEFPALLCELGLMGAGVEIGVQAGLHARHILDNWKRSCPKCVALSAENGGDGKPWPDCVECAGMGQQAGTLWCVDPWRAFGFGERAVDLDDLRIAIDTAADVTRWVPDRCNELLAVVDRIPRLNPGAYVDLANTNQEQHDQLYLKTLVRLAPYTMTARCHVWRMSGNEAAQLLPDLSLDFVYIDARHDFESVYNDLLTWTPKVKPGGIIAGHDYIDGDITFDSVVDKGGNVMKLDTPTVTNFGVKKAVDKMAQYMGWKVMVTSDDGPFYSWYVQIPEEV